MCFVRGERNLCRNMVRQKIKGTKVRRSLSPEEEPNFYMPEWKTMSSSPMSSPQTDSQDKNTQSAMTSLSPVSASPCHTQTVKSPKKVALSAPNESLVSMMRDTPKQTVTALYPPPPVIKQLQASPIEPPSLVQTCAKGGDLLFFEGRPFRYLEHIDEIPPVPFQTHSYKDKLHSMINSIVMDSSNWQDNQRNVCSV